jgi:transposase
MERIGRNDLTQKEAAGLLGVSERQVKRIWKRYKASGLSGIQLKHVGKNRSFDATFKEQVLAVVRGRYADFKPTFASEKLAEIENLKVNRETLRQWMIEDGLWKKRRRRAARIHQSRIRRSRFGEMIQIDGSPHDWFEGRSPYCCAYVFIDDATSRLMALRFEPTETTQGYFRTVYSYLIEHGRPASFYSDKDSVFVVGRCDSIDGLKGETQFQRAMRQLQIVMISAHSPQAKGRVERANQTLQDRLIKEMRLRGINNMEEANKFSPEFIKMYNQKFAKPPAVDENAHRLIGYEHRNLIQILSYQEGRTLSKNLEFSYYKVIYQIQRIGTGYSLRHAKVIVCEKIDGTIDVLRGQEILKYKVLGEAENQPELSDSKTLNKLLDEKLASMAA